MKNNLGTKVKPNNNETKTANIKILNIEGDRRDLMGQNINKQVNFAGNNVSTKSFLCKSCTCMCTIFQIDSFPYLREYVDCINILKKI